MSERAFDVIVFGATSFVGEILCRYLLDRHGATGSLRWAIAGRSESKLKQLQSSLGAEAAPLPRLIADSSDPAALRTLCQQTRVVITTVGPYALYGEALVSACADTGTDYCDLTGEAQWIKLMLDRYDAKARASGARIVHCCGFDSIPSDLGVHFLQQHVMAEDGTPCQRVRLGVKAARGEFSGGTVASLLNVVKETIKDPSLRKLLADPYAICPPQHGVTTVQPEVRFAEYDALAQSWVAPFIMAGINTRVVHRSNALLGYRYGRDFQYDEAMLTGDGFKGQLAAVGLATGIGAFLAATVIPPTRWALERWVLPKPGEGPSPEVQRNGFFDLRLFGVRGDGRKIEVKVTGDRDPGYGSTAKMLGEAGVCLALDIDKAAVPGGILTPASAMGDKLLNRLVEHAGLRFGVVG
jgi:short subunit dehydrogenase-like uncharacterized protein